MKMCVVRFITTRYCSPNCIRTQNSHHIKGDFNEELNDISQEDIENLRFIGKIDCKEFLTTPSEI